MKKILLTSIVLLIVSSIKAQEIKIPEPEFVGQAIIINSNNEVEILESSRLQTESDLKLFSLKTKYKFWLELNGCCSKTILEKSNTPIKFVVKAESNNQDPTLLYQIVKLEKEKTKRKLLASTMSIRGVKNNQDNFISFYGKKYENSSYILSASIPEPGEYGLLIGSIAEAGARSMQGSPSTIFTFTIK